MNVDEKLQFIEQVLRIEPNTLTEQTELADLTQWDSLGALNLQIELTVLRPNTTLDELRECKTISDICTIM